ncbi:hypothetical protein L0Z26_21350 [Burkholderia multivorans]|uniref:hypothetical protein n=1 Tax=Burkholderia multivorans TaxID=87883 RepID=UPI0015911795|nr:hypothetical protein [Burkholderia multivorans]MBH9663492.1 hypothetical protein [Burkholderia multivorans]MBU9239866.1 hypothetical protein [Burkholderia multivorans]MBU9650023.1 hypothetical protein [Burkholderia multivorans]MCO1344437.1 hypothetical protein [Burkholderia multivorans]MCO1441759.1 hypothetical protein [Burkholderia multivorans]
MGNHMEGEITGIKANIQSAFAMLSAQNFLLEQWYGQWFLRDPGARANVPKTLLEAARFRSTASVDSDDLLSIQRLSVEHMERFFASIETRLEEAEAARSAAQRS